MKKIEKCSYCKKEINTEIDSYFVCFDNFLQVKYFDAEDENIFCSKECFCDYVQLEEMNPKYEEVVDDE